MAVHILLTELVNPIILLYFKTNLIYCIFQITHTAIKSIGRKNHLTISKITNISYVGDTTDCVTIERPEFAVEVIKKEDHDDIDVPDHFSPENSSSDDDECAKNGKKIHEMEKVEISVKMDIEEEFHDIEVS